MGKTKMRLSQYRKSKKVLLKAVRLRRLELLCNTNEIKKSKDEPSSNPATSSNQFLGENCDQVSNQEVSDKSGYTPPMTSHSITNETEDIITDCYLSDVEDSEHEFYNKSSASFNNSDQEDSDQEILYEVEHSGIKETDKKIIITGRRIVEMSYFFNQLQQIKHEGFGCSFSDLSFISEKIEGLRSIFTFKCSICNITERIRTENLDDGTPQGTINISAVAGSVATGIGYSQLSELLAALDIPCMTNKTYSKSHEILCEAIDKENERLMRNAANEEARLAKECGEVTESGVPIISVIVDGAWSKRSYRTNYNALSGVACIIGARTKKILHVGVKNKYCVVCQRSEESEHKCSRNWNKTSTSMEAAIISEGFQESLKKYNIIYGRLIGDGDSSVYKRITESAPYGPTFVVEKIECRNHLLRNYLNKICDIRKDTKFPILLRKKVTNSDVLGRFRNAVTKAIVFRTTHITQTQNPIHTKAELLKKDIINGPNHIFGDHSNCEDYFCTKPVEKNFIPELQSSGIFSVIFNINQRLSNNVYSLLHNVDTNCAETYNSVVAKFVGGKRINFSLKNSYACRCKAASISYNSEGSFLTNIQAVLFKQGPAHFAKILCSKRQKHNSTAGNRQKSFQKRVFATIDEHYGGTEIDDMDVETYSIKSKEFIESLNNCDRNKIFTETILQSNSEVWHIERRKRLTASNFGKICKLRRSTSTANTISNLLYNTFRGNTATNFGLQCEENAIILFEKLHSKKVTRSGLIIDKVFSFLACSPDGLIDDDSIIEIKASDKSGELAPVEPVFQGKIDFCVVDKQKNSISLKRNHNYFYQIQGTLHISGRSLCYFLVYTRGGVHIEEIQRDDAFWNNNMEKKLVEFYMSALLPELVDSRRSRQQRIRDTYQTI